MSVEKQDSNRSSQLQPARDIAREKLAAMNFADVAMKAGGTYHGDDADAEGISIDYLARPVKITRPEMTVTGNPEDWFELGKPLRIQEEIFILHYLVRATGRLPTGNLIPFRQMDGGMVYDSVFRGRTVNRLAGAFGNHEEKLRDIGLVFGGTPGDIGNVSINLKVLPHVELAFVLWKGDDEIPPSGNILFDESVTDYLPTEDCTVMAESVTGRIIHVLKQHAGGI